SFRQKLVDQHITQVDANPSAVPRFQPLPRRRNRHRPVRIVGQFHHSRTIHSGKRTVEQGFEVSGGGERPRFEPQLRHQRFLHFNVTELVAVCDNDSPAGRISQAGSEKDTSPEASASASSTIVPAPTSTVTGYVGPAEATTVNLRPLPQVSS